MQAKAAKNTTTKNKTVIELHGKKNVVVRTSMFQDVNNLICNNCLNGIKSVKDTILMELNRSTEPTCNPEGRGLFRSFT